MYTDMTAGRYDHDTNGTIPWFPELPQVPTQIDPEAMVLEFLTAMEAPQDIKLRAKLVDEELHELLDAMDGKLTKNAVEYYSNILKEAADLLYVLIGWSLLAEDGGDEESLPLNVFNAAERALDTVTHLVGAKTLLEAFQLVHQSNMTKLGDDGKPVRREDGKIVKGPNYKAPDLTELAKATIRGFNLTYNDSKVFF